MKAFICVLALAMAFAAPCARGDALIGPRPPRNPNPPQGAEAPAGQFIAQVADGQAPTVLVIPRDAFAAAGAHSDATNVSPVPTVIAGFALSAAITIGGLQVARGKRRNGAILLAAAAIGISMIAHAVSAADAPTPDTGHKGPLLVDLTSQPTAVHVTLSRDLAGFLTGDAMGNN